MAIDPQIVDELQSELLKHIKEVRLQVSTIREEEILRRMPITYGELSARTSRKPIPRGMGPYLTLIGNSCTAKDLPRLDYLVVSKRSRRPSFLPDEAMWRREVMSCYGCKAYHA